MRAGRGTTEADKRGAALLLAFTVMFGCGGAATAAAPETDYPALVRSLSTVVTRDFYDPHLHGVDWIAVTRTYEARAKAVRSDAEFARLAAEMTGLLKSSHVNVYAPASPAPRSRPGIKTRELDGRTVISEVAPLSDAQAKGLRPGQELLDRAALPGPLGSSADVAVRTCAGESIRRDVRREAAFWPPPQPAYRWTRIRTGPGATPGYLRVDAFDDGSAELADDAMAQLADTNGLVIDLRWNDGGNASAVRLASYFVREAGRAIILLDRGWLERLGRTPTPTDALRANRVERTYTSDAVWGALKANGGAITIWTEDLGAKRYSKPVVVLIGADSASAAEGFAWVMRLRSPAVLIGEPTAGALLSADKVDLGQGWSVRIPKAGVWAPDGADYGDRAVPPHVSTPVMRSDLCSGRDAALERAIQELRGRLGNS